MAWQFNWLMTIIITSLNDDTSKQKQKILREKN